MGGPDIEPWRYGQEVLPECGPQNIQRDAMEWKLLTAALKADKPVLGVCRGIQVLNVLLGGTLYQDIPSQYKTELCHSMPEPPYNRNVHSLQVVEGTPLAALSPVDGVNSRHHQAVLDLAPGLEIMAYSSDGIIEAARMPEKRFVWAVQWHPEAFWEEEGIHLELFRKLVIMSSPGMGCDDLSAIQIPTIGFSEEAVAGNSFMRGVFSATFGIESVRYYNVSHGWLPDAAFHDDADGNGRSDLVEWMLLE